MFYIFTFFGIIGLLFFQDYIRDGNFWPILYFIGLIIIFLVKQYLEDKELKKRNH